MTALREALSEQALRRALAAFLAFAVLMEAVWLVLLLYAHDLGGPTAVGLVAVAQLVPATVLAPLTTVWVDRLPVRGGLVLAYSLVAATTGLLGLLLLVSAPVWAVVLAAVVQSVAVTTCRPAHYAALPRLAELPSHLVAANAVTGTVDSLGVLLGPVLIAVAVTYSASAPAVIALAVVLAVGAGVLRGSRVPVRAGEDETGLVREPFLRSALLGAREVRRIPGAFTLLVMVGLVWVVQGALDVVGVSFAIDVLDVGDQGASAFAAGNGLGLLLGAAAAVTLVGIARLSRVFVAGAVVTGAALGAVGLADTLLVAVALMVVSGAARAFVDIAGRTLLHRNADDRAMARVFGIQEAVLTAGMAVGAVLAPLAIAAIGPRWAFALIAGLLAVPALVALPRLAALDASGVVAARRVALMRRLPLFAPLSPPDLERLALATCEVATDADQVVIEQGAVGDCFYAIESGTYRVDKGDEAVAMLGRGQYFGEIALLHDVPRTASVTAVEPGVLLSLERAPFVAAMGRERPAQDAP